MLVKLGVDICTVVHCRPERVSCGEHVPKPLHEIYVHVHVDPQPAYLFVPYLQRFAADTVQDREKSALKSVLEHH